MKPYLVSVYDYIFFNSSFWMTWLELSVILFHIAFCCVAHFSLLYITIPSHHFMLNICSLHTIDK
jgi:hypothetical protein